MSLNAAAARATVTFAERQGPAVRENDRRPQLPSPRGPMSHEVIRALARPSGAIKAPFVRTDDALTNEDLQLALYCCYELHYQGFDHVSDDWEWNPSLKSEASSRRRSKEDSEQRFRMRAASRQARCQMHCGN